LFYQIKSECRKISCQLFCQSLKKRVSNAAAL
jgi:hypothetical protein